MNNHGRKENDMLVIDLNDGVSEGIRVCKSTDVAQVQLGMSSGTIIVSRTMAVCILEEILYTANLCYEQGYLNQYNTNGRCSD